MNLEQYVKSKKIEERAADAAKRSVDKVMRKIMLKSIFKVGDEITAKFKNHLGHELTVTGLIREVKNEVLFCNDNETGRPFAVNFDEVMSHVLKPSNSMELETLRDCDTSPNCKKFDEQSLPAPQKRGTGNVMRSENQLYEFGTAEQMCSDFDQWAYGNGLSRTSDEDGYFSKATQVASDAWNYRQTEVDELKKKLQLSQTEIKSLLSRTGIDHKKIEFLRNSTNELQKRVDAIKKIIKDAVDSGGNSSVEIVWDEILELEQALKGGSDASN